MTAPATGNRPGEGSLRYGGVSVPGIPNQKEDDLPSTWSRRAKAQLSALTYVRDCAGGPERMRLCGETYLPADPGEQPFAYANRLKRSFYFSILAETVQGLTGLVFVKDPVLGKDVPAAIVAHLENVDNAGTHFDVFAAEQFADSLTAGHNGILVDYPQTDGTQTAADEKREIRPYWVPILKDNIVSWRTEVINGKTVLAQLVLREQTDAPAGTYIEQEQTRYRRLFRDPMGVIRGELLQVNEDKTVTIIGSPWSYPTQTEIPFAEITTSGHQSLLVSRPPLLDLAYKTVEHYQLTSDRSNSAHKTCVPIWVETGINQEQDGAAPAIIIGPNTARRFTDPAAKAGYQSHDGAALGEVTKMVEELKSDMAVLGLQMLAPSTRSAETAQAKRMDKAASDSKLGRAARGLQDGLERALGFHAKYMKLETGGSVTINRDFENLTMLADMLTAYVGAVSNAGLPIRVLLEAMQKGGLLADSADLEALEAEVAANQQAIADQKAAELQMTLDAKAKQPKPKAGAPI